MVLEDTDMLLNDKMTPVEAFQLVMSLKLHFTRKEFNAVKYRFKINRLSQSSFDKQNNKYHLEKLARRYKFRDALWYVASNCMEGKTWVANMSNEPYTELLAYHESMEYKFASEMKFLASDEPDLDKWMISVDSEPPRILKALASHKISIHGVALLNCLSPFLHHEMKKVKDPLGLWGSYGTKAIKYSLLLFEDLDHEQRARLSNLVIQAFTLSKI